ncbi:hypothetical protein TNCV_4558961 [Trichonephila clavipes]|nr:hypothetical protein TNCV_4558961 [Trichonephila clavipes]
MGGYQSPQRSFTPLVLHVLATSLHPTKPGTASQGPFRSRYGMEESAQVPVPNMSRKVVVSVRFTTEPDDSLGADHPP